MRTATLLSLLAACSGTVTQSNADLSSPAPDLRPGSGDLAAARDLRSNADGAPSPDLATNDLACTSECSAGQTRCAGDGTVVLCVVGANGCGSFPSGGGGVCPTHQSCSAGACQCEAAPQCSKGAGSYCTNDLAHGNAPATFTCGTDGNGCLFQVATLFDCGARQSCTGTTGAQRCTCNADAACPGGGSYCDAGNGSFAVCSLDADGCAFKSGDTPCASPSACATTNGAGSAACVCPAAGNTAGTGCGNAGDKGCSADNIILTCQPSGACNLWSDTLDCAASGLACVANGGNAHCSCAPPQRGIFIVDPNTVALVVGGDTMTPTGAIGPPGCRYSTLGSAIAAAQAYLLASPSPASVKVLTDSDSGGVFNNESWPVTIPSGVTVSSDDTLDPPLSYLLTPPTDQGALVVEGGGSVRGLVVSADITTSTNPPAAVSLVHCTSPAPAVSVGPLAIQFQPNALGDGVNLADPADGEPGCNATLTGVTIQNALNGFSVSSSSSAASPMPATATFNGGRILGSRNDGVLVYQSSPAGISLNQVQISGSQRDGVELDTSLFGRKGTISLTGPYPSGPDLSGLTGGVSVANGGQPGDAIVNLTDYSIEMPVGNIGDALAIVGGTAHLKGGSITGGRIGLLANGSSVTIDPDADGNPSTFSGCSSPAVWIDTASTLTANQMSIDTSHGGLLVLNQSFGGASVTSATLNGCTVSTSSTTGIDVSGSDALHTSSVTVSGGTITQSASHGIHVGAFGSADVQGANMTGNQGDGVLVDADSASFTAESSALFASNAGAGVEETAGSVTLTGVDGGPIRCRFNLGGGILHSGAAVFVGHYLELDANHLHPVSTSPTTGTFLLDNSNLHDNTDGSVIYIDNGNASDGAVQIVRGLFQFNSNASIEVHRSLVPASGYSTQIKSGNLQENSGPGVLLGGGGNGELSVLLSGTFFGSNGSAALLYDSSATTNSVEILTTAAMGNAATAVGDQSTGGMSFAGTAPASLFFQGNIVSDNGGNQMLFVAASGAQSYDLSAGGNTIQRCDINTGFAVFGEAANGAEVDVDASNVSWFDATFPGNNLGSSGGGVVSVAHTNAGVVASCFTP
jgi:hypothetical protein